MATAWRWILPVLTISTASCTVLYDMGGYSSGVGGEAGLDAEVDSAPPVDSTPTDSGPADSTDPIDTGRIDSGTVPDSTTVDSATVDSDAGGVADTAVVDSRADTTVVDSGTDTAVVDSGTDTGVTDSATSSDSSDAAPVGCHLVINEVQTRSVASGIDEFVEIYNPCDVELPLAGWKLAYRSAAGTSESNLVTSFAAGAKVVAKGFFIAANVGGSFAAGADATFTSGIADDGSVGLRNTTGTLIDSVGWGTAAATNPFVEKAAAPGPASGASISRMPKGTDTDDNSSDFKSTSPSTPKS